MYKKHSSMFVLTIVMTIAMILGSTPVSLQADQGAVNKQGNTMGNHANWGYYAKQGDWIYFSNDMDNRRLYKMKLDASSYMKLNDAMSFNINVIGDWIYYINIDEEHVMYKIKTDGTGKTRISTDKYVGSMFVEGNWIYYFSGAPRASLYKIDINGKNKKLLTGKDITEFVVVGDYIYYDERGVISRIKTDGTGKKTIVQGGGIYEFFSIDGDWIYFSSLQEDMKLYKAKTNGTGKVKVADVYGDYKNIVGGWIYYSNFKDGSKLYKVKTNGTGKTKLSEGPSSNIQIIDNWLFFKENDIFYRAKLDGTGKQRMQDLLIKTPEDITSEIMQGPVNEMGSTNDNIRNDSFMVRQGDWLFYLDGNIFYRQKAEGSRKEIVKYFENPDILSDFNVVGNTIYYMESSKIYKMLNNGANVTKVNDDEARYMYVIGDWIYYVHNTENRLYKMKTDGSEKILLCNESVADINIVDGWLYYNSDDRSTRGLYKMKLDGSEKSKISDYFFSKMIIYNNDIYYLWSDDANDWGKLYKTSLPGKTIGKKIGNDIISQYNKSGFNLIGGWIYFTDTQDYNALYRIKTDGSGRTRVGDYTAIRANVLGDMLYINGFAKGSYGVYKMKADGTGIQAVK